MSLFFLPILHFLLFLSIFLLLLSFISISFDAILAKQAWPGFSCFPFAGSVAGGTQLRLAVHLRPGPKALSGPSGRILGLAAGAAGLWGPCSITTSLASSEAEGSAACTSRK